MSVFAELSHRNAVRVGVACLVPRFESIRVDPSFVARVENYRRP